MKPPKPVVADDMAAILADLNSPDGRGEPFPGRRTQVRRILDQGGSRRGSMQPGLAVTLFAGAVGIAIGMLIRQAGIERASAPQSNAPGQTDVSIAAPTPRPAPVSVKSPEPAVVATAPRKPPPPPPPPRAGERGSPPPPIRSGIAASDPDAPLFIPSIPALARGTPLFRANPAAPPAPFPSDGPAPATPAAVQATTAAQPPSSPGPVEGKAQEAPQEY